MASASPAIVTAANPTTASVGATRLQDTATLSEGYNPTGEITFTLYASDDITSVYSEQVAAAGNTTVSTTNGWVPTRPGHTTGRPATAATATTTASSVAPPTNR